MPLLPWEPKRAQVARAGRDRDVVQVRPEAGALRGRGRGSSRASSGSIGRRLTLVARAVRRPGRARRRPHRRTAGAAARALVAAGLDQRGAELGDAASVHGAIASRSTALERGVALRPAPRRSRRGSACAREAAGRACGRSTRAARAGPALTIASRSGVKTSVAGLAAELLRRPQARAVQLRPLPLAGREQRRRSAPASAARTPSSRMPRGRARRSGSAPRPSASRGEKPWVPTCSDSSRFVLPAPFAPDGENEPGSSGSSRRAYDRKFARSTEATISRRGGSA